jgi:hypothetical protein
MKKFFLVLCCVAMLSVMLSAQARTGNLYGTVLDREGTPLPGATITLTGPTIAPMTAQSSAEGKFRFLSLFPGNQFQLKIELQGFKTKIESGVIINVNSNSDISVVMEQGALEEQVTVVAKTPVVQAKKTQITHTINYEQLQELPSARDPWVILQMTPSILMDRENVGGVESGQQSSFMAKGSTTQEWTVDGMQTTDRNSGGSPGYYDFDAFEEMNISTGMMDVEHRDPGIVIALITRRGGNKSSLGGRFFYSNEKFQGSVPDSVLTKYNIAGFNRAYDIKDFGFNAGGPIFKDKVWWWASYGVQQIQTYNLLNVRDDTYLNNYSAKLNFQIIPENRAEVLYMAGDKKKFGRDSNNVHPPGRNQHSNFYFGNPTLKIQDEQMFGDNLFFSARYGWSNAGFGLWPAEDESITKPRWRDITQNLYYNSFGWFYSDRPHPYTVLQAQYFNDNLFGTGTSHEIKIGGEINNNSRTYTGGVPGNFHIYTNYNTETVDWNLDGKVDVVKNLPGGPDIKRIYIGANDTAWEDGTKRLAFYFSDSISFSRFNINLGLRVDRMIPYINPELTRALWLSGDSNPADSKYLANYPKIASDFFPADTLAKLAPLIPEKQFPYVESKKLYWIWSPRVGVTYDIFGDGRTIAKAAYTLYRGGGLGTGYWTPFGLYGSMNYYWADLNNDVKPQLNELYWADYSKSSRPAYRLFDDDGNFQGNWAREFGLHWSGWDINNPGGLSPSASYCDFDNWSPSKTHELFFSLEREIIQDFGVSLSYSWRKMGNYSWSPNYYPEEYFPGLNNHLRSQDDYELGGTVPDTLVNPATGETWDPKEAKGKPWYVLKNIPETASTSYSKTVMMDPGRYNIYWGFDFVLTKRLSHRWMLNGSVTYQMERTYYGSKGYMDPTGMWAYEGSIYGIGLGGSSGKITVNMFSRWLVKLTGMYQLPWDLNVSGTLSAHEGSFFGESFGVQDRTLPNPRSYSNSLPTITYDNRSRLGDVWTVNLKLEKMIRLGDTSRMYFSADIFNAINVDPLLRRYDIDYGTFRFTGGPTNSVPYSWTAPGATSGAYNEIMNPILIRFGMRFQI